MAKLRQPPPPSAASTAKQTLDSYTIKGSTKSIHPGDSVLMRPPEPGKPPYVARVETIEADRRGVRVKVQWYYRPEESIGGRRRFHGSKELFLSDHYDVQSADTIEGKCTVHTFKEYTGLSAVGDGDFFSRFQYKSANGTFIPDRIAVFCKCEMPYNPDDLMIQCEDCLEWYHPTCIDMTIEEAKKIEHFLCQSCSSEKEQKIPNSEKASGESSSSEKEKKIPNSEKASGESSSSEKEKKKPNSEKIPGESDLKGQILRSTTQLAHDSIIDLVIYY